MIFPIINKQALNIEDDKLYLKLENIAMQNKKQCSNTKEYCFTDNDCNLGCQESGMSCNHGICSNILNATDAENICDPKRGMIGYFVGNTALGTYDVVCKSVDPAIAISVSENRMCYNDNTYQIDYLTGFPSIYTCDCEGRIIIPATSQKREHVECNSAFIDLVL